LISPLSAKAIRKLVRWYSRHHRDLPWRRTRDPYVIWISEILLQQTQVETVRPYFLRFLQAFPTVQDLANASLDKVLKVWEGCGYYARAMHLHRAAKIVVASGGQLPRTAAELQKLPGIGAYTSAAIASIAFAEAVPVLDGNVERVLARVTLQRGFLKATATQKRLHLAASAIMAAAVRAKQSPGDLNQAFMELGATICKPRIAVCSKCPIQSECRACSKLSDVTILPKKAVRKSIPHYNIGAAIIHKNGRILITQRPLDGMLGGLWEFPGGKVHDGESLEECVRREIVEELGIEIAVRELFMTVKHAYTHFRITLHAFDCSHTTGRIQKIGVADYKWVKPAELALYAFPKADRVILEEIRNPKLKIRIGNRN
jgi:A/G-specific adenine glycosylase